MAKISKNSKRFPIRWNGTVQGGETQGDSIPSSADLGTWLGYAPCWLTESGGTDVTQCTGNPDDYFFEDFNVRGTIGSTLGGDHRNALDLQDFLIFNNAGMTDIANVILGIIISSDPVPPTAPRDRGNYTWGDIAFIQEIVDGIGTGSRRARQDRLNKILDDEDKKKKLIHLICRIKGEKVYDDYTEVGSIEVDVDDVELVVERMMGKKLKLEIKSGV
jgi:hypothetical protein